MPNWWGAGKAAPVQVATCWGEPSSRPPQCRSAAKCGGIARWGAKPRPVWRNARPPGFNGPRQSVDVVLIDCAATKQKHKLKTGGLAPQAHDGAVKGGKEAAGRPSPRSADRRGVQARRARRSGAARPESDFGKRLRESLAIARICRRHFPVSASKPPPNRGQVLSTKTPRSRRFRLSKRRPFRDEKHHGMQQI